MFEFFKKNIVPEPTGGPAPAPAGEEDHGTAPSGDVDQPPPADETKESGGSSSLDKIRRKKEEKEAAQRGQGEKALPMSLAAMDKIREHTKQGASTVSQEPPAGPSRAKSASHSLRRALLMPLANPGSRYRCGKRT